MTCRLFVRATPNRMASATTTMATELTTKGTTYAGIATLTNLPGAGAYYSLVAATSGTAARNMYLGLAGDGGNGVSCVWGTTQVDGGSSIAPTADGRWYLFAGTKATGTVSPTYYMLDMSTDVLTVVTPAGTSADRTAGAVTYDNASGGGADFWNGRIAMTGIFNRNMSQGEILQLVYPRAWRALSRDNMGGLCWLGRPDNRLDIINPYNIFSSGTAPILDSQAPPGWP